MLSSASRFPYMTWAAGLPLLCLIAAATSAAAALGRQLTLNNLGCFVDMTGGVRDLNGLKGYGFTSFGGAAVSQGSAADGQTQGFIASSVMTHELCASVCALGGFRYLALQSSQWCTCGNSYGLHGAAGSSGDCSFACTGNPSQVCGGTVRNTVLELNYAYGNSLFLPGNRTLVGISNPSVPAYSTLTGARSLTDCLCRCDSGSPCQAVIFNEQQRLCHLLEYAVVPGALSGLDSGSFLVRG